MRGVQGRGLGCTVGPGTVMCHTCSALPGSGNPELEQMASMGKAGESLLLPGREVALEHGSKLGSCKVHPRTFPSLCSLPEA